LARGDLQARETCKLGDVENGSRIVRDGRAMQTSPQQLGQAEGKQKPPLTKGGTQHRGVSAQARSQRM